MAKVGKIAAAGVAIGIGAAAFAAVKFGKAALEAEKSQTRLDDAFRHARTSLKDQKTAIEAVNKVMNQSGLDDEDLKDTLARLTQVTGDVTKAQRDMGIAADVARGRGIDLAAATNIVSKAELGNVGALKRIGIEIPKVTAAQDALKASHEKATQAQKDAAKAADDAATRQAAIAKLQAKFGGDAERFGKTAAGAMERFQVAAHNVEENLGAALLPALTKAAGGVASFLNRFNEAKGASEKFQVVVAEVRTIADKSWEALKSAFNAIDWGQVWTVVSTKAKAGVSKLGSDLAAFVRSIDWGQVGQAVGQAILTGMNKLDTFIRSVNWAAVTRAAIEGFKQMVVGIGRFLAGVDWGAVLGKMFHIIVAVFKAQTTILLTVAQALGAVVIKGILAGMEGIAGFVGRKLDNVRDAVVNAAKNAYGNALGVGKAIVQGVLDGVGGLFGSLKNKLESTLKSVLSTLNPFSPVSHGGEIYIGRPLAEGAVQGWILGSAALPAKMKESLRNSIEAARATIEASRGRFQTAWDSLASTASAALDGVQGAVKTKTEKILAAMDIADRVREINKRITDARAELGAAKTDQKANAVLFPGESIEDWVARTNAANERVKTAQDTLNQALADKQRSALEARAAEERRQLDAQQALQQVHFAAALTALGAQLSKKGKSAADSTKAVLALLADFGVNFKEVGQDMGAAYIQGLKEALNAAAGSAGALGSTVRKAAAGIGGGGPLKHVGGRAMGGPVRAGVPYRVGERGPETFVPGSNGSIVPNGGGGGTTVIQLLLDGRVISEVVRNDLISIARRNGSALGGLT
jgi:hypothetical protein